MLNDVCAGSAALWAWALSGHTGWLRLFRFALTHSAQPLHLPESLQAMFVRDFFLWEQDFVIAKGGGGGGARLARKVL